MEYEDTRRISTPEGVELELRLAGLGSRFGAGLIDFPIKAAIVLAPTVAAALLLGELAAVIVFAVSFFFAVVGYDVLFEVRAGGRTPGKRAAGLRVLMADGAAVSLRASSVRNLMRLIEGLPLWYLPAVISILVTHDNQRLGDLAANTIVAREPRGAGPPLPEPAPLLPDDLSAWDVSAVTADELAAVRSFLDRRPDFAPAARWQLAATLAERLRARVDGVPAGMDDERFLENLARAKAERR
jgi:uncharacterized RDD family membrane protein YckC